MLGKSVSLEILNKVLLIHFRGGGVTATGGNAKSRRSSREDAGQVSPPIHSFDPCMVEFHLQAVHRHNFYPDRFPFLRQLCPRN